VIVPRDAATIMLVRDSADGLEVLMLRRNLASSWVGGVHLFPGGAVDPADRSSALAARCEGRSDKEASRLLGIATGGLGYFVAAIRECFEEAGVLLAVSKTEGQDWHRLAEARRRLNSGEVAFADLLDEEDLFLQAGRLFYFSHWITPEGSPRRYDTRFFLAALPEGQSALHDDREVIDSFWAKPSDLLARARAGEIEMLLPTLKNLEAIGRFHSTEEALGEAARLEVRPVLPKVVEAPGEGVRILLPGDPGYDSARRAPEGAGFPDRSR
jgi:8-oxo-dGTP pyrophosphatase MutT (NUDIX family)